MLAATYRRMLMLFYPLYIFFTLIFQFFLLFMIIKHSPKSIHLLRIILSVTCCFQIILAISATYTQIRMVTTKNPIEMWAYGLCRYQENYVCYVFYQLEQLTALASALTIYGTFFLKYRLVTGVQLTKPQVVKNYSLFYLPVVLSTLLVYWIIKTQTLAWETQEQLRLINTILNPSTEYIVFALLSFQKLPNVLNLIVVTGCIICIPIISLYSRKKILRQINHHIDNMSAARQDLYKNFLTGLTIQCVIPYVFYIPIYILYYYCIFSYSEILFLQYFMTFVPALPCLIDPLVSLYFVTPFRRKLTLWIKREREETRTTNAFTL